MEVKVEYLEGADCEMVYYEEWVARFDSIAELMAYMGQFEECLPDVKVSFGADGVLSIYREL